MGWKDLPTAGDEVYQLESESKLKELIRFSNIKIASNSFQKHSRVLWKTKNYKSKEKTGFQPIK